MVRTVDFYSGTLGMPLVKTIELPFGMGQHFFFDPDRILLEFAAWTRPLGLADVRHEPAAARPP